MYLDIHTLEIANGLKDALINADFTIESILKRGPSEIASIMGIRISQGSYLMLPKKLLNLMVLYNNNKTIIILSNRLVPCDLLTYDNPG